LKERTSMEFIPKETRTVDMEFTPKKSPNLQEENPQPRAATSTSQGFAPLQPTILEQVVTGVTPYLRIARMDHWFKNIFMLPGIGAAYLLNPEPFMTALPLVIAGIISTCLAASANYTINEYLDAAFDRLHPLKCNRPCALGLVNPKIMVFEYLLLVAIALLIAFTINIMFFSATALLLILGLLYNVPPVRTKDIPVIDVLTESLNNPVRFVLGWSIFLGSALPPSSILLTYWFGGAFLMSVKRYAEFREIGRRSAIRYRRSFNGYSQNKLLLLSFFCALNASFFLAIFLIKYRIELLLTFPFYALLFAWYLRIGLKKGSNAQRPEKLYQEKWFVAYVLALAVFTIIVFTLDVPWLRLFLEHNVY
jgi:decaprenyl-phosphate phosphoribosyltransferase